MTTNTDGYGTNLLTRMFHTLENAVYTGLYMLMLIIPVRRHK